MDVRVIACIVPLAPFIFVGSLSAVGIFTHHLSPMSYFLVGMFFVGLAGVGGLFLASRESTYRSPRKARLATYLLLCGILSAFACMLIYATNAQNKLVTVFVISNLLCPVIVAFDCLGRLAPIRHGLGLHGASDPRG